MAVRGHWTNQWRIPHDTLKQLTAFKDEPIEFRLNSDWIPIEFRLFPTICRYGNEYDE